MKQKRYIGILAVAGLTLAVITGCSTVRTAGSIETQVSSAPEAQETGASVSETAPYMRTPELPMEYRITYEMENGDGTVSLITMAKNSEGNLYYRDGAEELWFLSQKNGYVQAIPDENTELIPISSGTILKEKAVRERTAAFWKCVETSGKLVAPGFSHAGTAAVAERTCDLYTLTMGITGLNVTYQLYIDQETGVCLGWTEEKETGIFDSEASKGTFLCSEFQTEDVVLPYSAE